MGAVLRITRFILSVVWFCGLTLVFFIYALLRPFNTNLGVGFCRVATPILFRIMGIRFILRNGERLRSIPPAIFIGNHQSTLDLFFFGGSVPDRTLTIVKKGIMWIPVFGGLYLLTGSFVIHRRKREAAARTLAKVERRLGKDALSLMIFPEGTRSRGRGIGPFKAGAFRLAVNTGFPIQPIAVSTYYKRLDLRRWHAGTVIAEVLEPIPTGGMTQSDIPKLIDRAHDRIGAAIARLDLAAH